MSRSWEKGSTRAWRRLRAGVLARDGYVCQLQLPGCTQHATHAEHVVPKSRGGRDVETNMRASCGPCNIRRGDSSGGDPPMGPARTQW